MKTILFSLLALSVLTATALQSAEIIPVWHKQLEEGGIQDMELMPGGDEFMLTTSKGEIQIRNSENGELVRSHIDSSQFFMNGYFEFTPDSNRVVMGISGLLQLIDIHTFERLKYFAFGPDTIAKGFKDIVLDPVKPYAYVIVSGWEKTSGKDETRSKVQVYNYETMELVKDLTDYSKYEYTAIAVSPDGRYLATLNNGKAYLKVWDLATMDLIRNVQLWDDKLPNADWWCESKDIQFSKLNSDVIFYSGGYPVLEPKGPQGGIRQFTISSSAGTGNIVSRGVTGGIVMFDNEKRSLIYRSGLVSFYNFTDKFQEFYGTPPNNIFTSMVRYSRQGDFFISSGGNKISKFLYDRQTSVATGHYEEIIISPNPTNSIVNIQLSCPETTINYSINDTNGLLLFQSTAPNQGGNLQINFIQYPTGVYFLTLNCNQSPKTYKIIKEG